jgi:hypothetical protein
MEELCSEEKAHKNFNGCSVPLDTEQNTSRMRQRVGKKEDDDDDDGYP